ncbi:MAG: LON peptidase substrate-binding domain-containing protein, partial [Thermoanaerobaculia bacterium]
MTERMTLPVLPLRDFVLFPGVTAPINAGKPATLRAIEAALATPERLVFAVSQREDVPQVTPEALHTIGTVAKIGQIQRGLGGMQLLLQGEHRGIAMRIIEKDGHLEATVREADEMRPLNAEDPAFVGLFREARERAAELGTKSGLPEEVVHQVLESVTDPGRLADVVAAYTDVPSKQRQMLLETLSVEERLRRVLLHVQRQLEVLEAQEDIKSRVQEELGDRQREMFLREQLKAIQKELGEGEGGNEMEELRERLDKLELPADVRKEVDRELARLGRMGREAMETQVIRNYLETVAELPWNERSPEHLDIPEAARILEEDHYALGDVKDRVLEFLAVRQLRMEEEAKEKAAAEAEDKDDEDAKDSKDARSSKGPILLFVGPPGVGKTSVAK